MSHSLASRIGKALAAHIWRGRIRYRTKAVRDYVEKSQAISAAGLRTDPATLAAVERGMFGDNLAFRPTGETMSKVQNFAEETGHAAAPGGEFIRHFGGALAGGNVDYGEPYEPDAEVAEGEEVIGEVKSAEVKALFTRLRATSRQMVEALVKVQFARTDAERDSGLTLVQQLKSESEFVKGLFWHAVRLESGSWPSHVGLRKDWQIVRVQETSIVDDILLEIIGGGLGLPKMPQSLLDLLRRR
jgi:hypothetical protein